MVMDKKKKAIPVRKLLEMERRAADSIVNNENDLSDANRSTNAATSILGSLERLVETSFKPNNAVTAMDYVAQQVMVAKRAFGAELSTTEQGEELVAHGGKRVKVEPIKDEEDVGDSESRTTSPERSSEWAHQTTSAIGGGLPAPTSRGQSMATAASSSPSSSAELKFLKYSELARELSGR